MNKRISNPKVSVIMSVYNEEEIVMDAIESILNQTFKNFEFIIVNDGSTDKTPEILENYTKKDKRIKIITNSKNIGLTKSLNKAIKQARGKYIARMDADEISFKHRFEKQVEFLERNFDIALVGSFTKIVNKKNGKILNFKPFLDYQSIKKAMFFSNQFSHSSVMLRRDIIQELGGYNEDFIFAQDYELWLRIMQKWKIVNIPKFLGVDYRREKGIGETKRRKQIYFGNKAKINAIRQGIYPLYYIIFLPWPFISILIPDRIKKLLKKIIFQSENAKIYF